MSRSITPNPVSSQAITVSSAAGFNAGDLVYFNGSTGDYGTPPTSAPGATVSVPAIGPVPLLSGVIGANSNNVGILGACATTGFAAILTNGNIVQVFISGTGSEASFRIVDTSGAVVVAVTSISGTFTQSGTPNIAVTALTGGGFAVAWVNNGGGLTRPCYAIYSNTGTVVTAAQQDTGAGPANAAAPIRIKATPSGGFIIAYLEQGAATYARGYSATGVAAFAWVSLPTTGSNYIIGLAVRNDGSFLLVGGVNSASTIYGIWSSTGTPIVSSTSFASANGIFSTPLTDATCLSDGTTFVIVYAISLAGYASTAFRFLPTGNVLGSEFYVPNTNFLNGTNSYQYNQDVTALSGNRFIIGMISGANTYALCYAVFNSSGVCLSGTAGTVSTGAAPINISQTYLPHTSAHMSVIESPAGYLTLYYGNSNSRQYGFFSSTVDSTTYAIVNPLPSTQTAGNASSGPVAYARSGSSPLGAAYSINAGTYNTSGTYGTVIKNPELVANGVYSVANTTLPDGRVLIAYMDNGGAVKVAVYSVNGVFIQTLNIAVDGGTSISAWSYVSIAALTSGKFVISYATSTGTVSKVKLYSSAFTQIGSDISITTAGTTSGYTVSVASITNDRYIITYSNFSNYPTYRVYDNTNTQLVGDTVVSSNDRRNVCGAGFSTGGFLVTGRATNNVQFYSTFINSSGNSFSGVQTETGLAGAANITTAKCSSNTFGGVCVAGAYAATQTGIFTVDYFGNQPAPATTMTSIIDTFSTGIGFTGSGVPLMAAVTTSGVLSIRGIRTTNISETQLALNATLFQPLNNSVQSPQISITPSYGGNAVIAFIDISYNLRFAIVCGTSLPVPMSLTANDPSTPVPIYPGATSASPAIQNTIFAGVALQTVPPGGAGLVQVNGTAQLNSTYPAGTTYRAFDHQSQGVPGVKGTITGRTITLQGNT